MHFEPTVWTWSKSEDDSIPVTIELCKQIDGTKKYAVRQLRYCLNKKGEWEFEPIPSSRTDAFFKRCRFSSWEDAAAAVEKHLTPSGKFTKT